MNEAVDLLWQKQHELDYLRAKLQRLRIAAKALLDDVQRRHPGEELHCPYMKDLAAAVKE